MGSVSGSVSLTSLGSFSWFSLRFCSTHDGVTLAWFLYVGAWAVRLSRAPGITLGILASLLIWRSKGLLGAVHC